MQVGTAPRAMFDPSSPMVLQKQLTLPEKDPDPGSISTGKETSSKKEVIETVKPIEKVPVLPVIGKSSKFKLSN